MDKFAVDIEKVLDEFEYNEEREESIPSVINNLSITQKPFKSAASAYRRPTFEPINLADADFSAAPINPQNYTLTKQKNKNNNEEISNYLNENFDDDDDDNDDNDNKVEDVVSEQPDLLDLNNKPAQNINEDPDYKLPDITSVTNIKEEEKIDLIKEEVKPVSFESDNVSESELEEYLQYLEEEESKKEEKEVDEFEVEEIIVRTPSTEIYKITDVSEEDLLENDIEEQVEPQIQPEAPEEIPEPQIQPELPEAHIEEEKEEDNVAVEENLVNENIENVEKSANHEVLENSTESIESDENERPSRPSSLPLESSLILDSEESPTPTNITASSSSMTSPMDKTGKVAPFWVPDAETDCCMQCKNKFTVIRRRHHCRACGYVLCSKCCNLKAPLEYLEFTEARVCQPCFNVIYRVDDGGYSLPRQPNPNNPMEYCSTIPPLQQAASSMNQPPPSVLVPTGVLKREGRAKSDVPKQVIFSDGIRPGGDLTELDGPSESRVLPRRGVRRIAAPPNGYKNRNSPIIQRPLDPSTKSYIPSDSSLPPSVNIENGQLIFIDDTHVAEEPVKFAINNNLFVNIKRVKLDCCVKRDCWSVSSEGLAFVGQDEIAIVLEIAENETLPPVDIFHLVNTLYLEASKGTTVGEMSFTPAFSNNMFGSKDHGGFLYIRPTFQCTTNLLLPPQPFLITILVHRWETPWARLFPLRLVLRLGAEYRYYPCPLVSVRFRPPLYTDIGQTVIKLLVDFRKYGYTLATVRGLLIHMEDRQTTILFPRNGYDQVLRALNNSNDSVLAFGANLSLEADSHLVCIQSTKDENTYSSQAINIQSKPRKVTGASFVVFNGALKTAGLSGKSSIVEDGLMVHIPSESMVNLRTALREMKDYTIICGPNDEETVNLRWCADDTNFNIGVKSFIDDKPLDGIPSIRVHNGTDYPSVDQKKIIRWTEVFILKSEEGSKATDPLDISRVSESIASATCMALVPMLDSLAAANLTPLAIRANIHPDNVGYEAGSGGSKLPTVYMNRLDEELIRVLHQAAMSSHDTPAVLELILE